MFPAPKHMWATLCGIDCIEGSLNASDYTAVHQSNRVKTQILARIQILSIFLGLLLALGAARAQESTPLEPAPAAPESPLPQPPGASAPPPVQVVITSQTRCVQPPPLLKLSDYQGPFNKFIGIFAVQLERRSVGEPHFRPGAALCSLNLKDKFLLFVRESYDPVTFLAAGFNAGLAQAFDQDPPYHQGLKGYSKRYVANLADQASYRFFRDFAYPSIFSEDPRYYRMGRGSVKARLLHAVDHSFVAYSDSGHRMFNFSEWLGTVSAVSLGNLYHPGNERGFSPAARGVAFSVLNDMGFDILREFWPEIANKFKLPFRQEPLPEAPSSTP